MVRSTVGRLPSPGGWRVAVSVAAVLVVPAGLVVDTGLTSQAATTGCQVAYTVTSSWAGGFTGDVSVTNLGSAVSGWTLGWSFSAGQTVTQAWNATVTQSGSAVTATNVSYNGSIATGGNVDFGFNGSWTSSNPAPAGFALNGVTCTGATSTSPPTSAPPTTAPPTSAPPTSASPSASPTGTSSSGVPTATGDARSVSEPKVPGTICATLTSGLTMTNRESGSTQEATPPDTSRIQSALNSCSQTGSTPVAVKLVASGAHTAFLSAPLTVPAGVALVIDSGVTLFASLNAADYQVANASATCGTVSAASGGCKPFITVGGSNSGIEAVRAADGTQGGIDGRGDLDINGTGTSWFDLAATAKSESLTQNNPRLIQANKADNFTLYDIDLLDAANFHVVYENATGFTAWGVRIKTPATAGNTDGIDPSGAVNVTIANSYIMDGDDGVAIKAGSVASKNITIENDHFYGTHGISIGSETAAGVTNMLVENNTVSGVDADGAVGGSPIGLRIKSNSSTGGTVQRISYLNNCVTQVKQPLVFDTHYSSATGSDTPFFTDILINGLRSTSSMSGSASVIDGFSSSFPIGLTLMNVSLDKTATTAQFAKVGLFDSNLTPTGTGVTTSSVSGGGSVPSCSFPTYPAL